jgi:uncharacterized protein YbaA (DUF1428 family)
MVSKQSRKKLHHDSHRCLPSGVKLILFIPIFIFQLSTDCFSQSVTLPPTKAIRILGKINSPVTINDIDFKKFKTHPIGDVQILHSNGQVKRVWKDLTGIRLRDLLDTVKIDVSEGEALSQFYYVCKSIDGNKVVFSWNEIFNTSAGESIYIVLMRDDRPMEELNENILLITLKDNDTRFRYLKNLEEIHIQRAE